LSTVPTGCGARISIGGVSQDAGFGAGIAGAASRGLTFGVVAEPTAWVFSAGLGDDEASVAETVSHETGHTFSLDHDGGIGHLDYYPGHGTGATGWCPIMGDCFSRPLSQWSQGEYPSARNQEDDIAIIAARAPLRPDDVPDTAQLSDAPAAVDQPGLTARGATPMTSRSRAEPDRPASRSPARRVDPISTRGWSCSTVRARSWRRPTTQPGWTPR
jgi:hypothetical protein